MHRGSSITLAFGSHSSGEIAQFKLGLEVMLTEIIPGVTISFSGSSRWSFYEAIGLCGFAYVEFQRDARDNASS